MPAGTVRWMGCRFFRRPKAANMPVRSELELQFLPGLVRQKGTFQSTPPLVYPPGKGRRLKMPPVRLATLTAATPRKLRIHFDSLVPYRFYFQMYLDFIDDALAELQNLRLQADSEGKAFIKDS